MRPGTGREAGLGHAGSDGYVDKDLELARVAGHGLAPGFVVIRLESSIFHIWQSPSGHGG